MVQSFNAILYFLLRLVCRCGRVAGKGNRTTALVAARDDQRYNKGRTGFVPGTTNTARRLMTPPAILQSCRLQSQVRSATPPDGLTGRLMPFEMKQISRTTTI